MRHLVAFVLSIGVSGLVASGRSENARIAVGPNVRVSRSSNDPRVELVLAANPKNQRNLIGASIVSRALIESCDLYVSHDAGNTWIETALPSLPPGGTGDPQVAFGADGAAYFSVLGRLPAADGSMPFVDVLYRSADEGLSWQRVAVLGAGRAPDRDVVATDPRPDHADHVVIAVVLNGGTLGLFRSYDRGDTFDLSEVVPAGDRGVQSLTPLLLSEGTVVVPFLSFERKALPDRRPPGEDLKVTRSADSGQTFQPALEISSIGMNPHYRFASPYPSVELAADRASPAYHDRLYVVWSEAEGEHYRIRLASSRDRGATWSSPRDVDETGAAAEQFRPAIAVNGQGVVGISWFDSRLAAGARAYDEWFTASLDGGETFLPSVRVSRETSRLDVPGNLVLKPTIDSTRTAGRSGDVQLAFADTAGRFPDFGDYMGIAADAGGDFHPFWADTRTGSSQVWTAAVRLTHDGARAESEGPTRTVTADVEVLLDPARVQVEAGVEEIPVRLRNRSNRSLCPPIVAAVKSIDTDAGPAQLVAASGGALTGTATVDYSRALGDFSCLDPDTVSEAVIWRVKLPDPARRFLSLRFDLTAR